MKIFQHVYKDYWEVEDTEHYVFPKKNGLDAVEVSYATTALTYDTDEKAWDLDIDVYGYRLTAKGTRDKRGAKQQLFGFTQEEKRKKFLQELGDRALGLHLLTRNDLASGQYIFSED
jgi:hypothetical protein